MKKFLRVTIALMIVLTLILSGNIMKTLAVTSSDLNDIQKNIDKTKGEIQDVDRKLSGALSQIQSLNAEIAEYENEISDLNYKIDSLDAQISESEAQIKKAEEDYAHQQELLKTRLVAMYEAGETTYLDVLLSSKSITEFISKYYIVSEIADNDKNLLEQIDKNKTSIEEAKKKLEESKEQIEELKKDKENTANSLKESRDTKQSYVNALSEEEKGLEEELEQYEQDKREVQAELERIARENAAKQKASGQTVTVTAGTPSSAGYIFPVQGLNIYNINRRYYPSYPGHTGVDVNIGVYR